MKTLKQLKDNILKKKLPTLFASIGDRADIIDKKETTYFICIYW